MNLRLGDIAPDFEADCFFPEDAERTRISFHDWSGTDSWVILFSHPADFTPVCTTELGRVAQLASVWQSLNCKVIGLSTDTVISHREWSKDIEETSGCHFNFPIIADHDLKVSMLYGMLDQMSHDPSNFDAKTSAPLPVRTVFILDPRHRVRLTLAYPAAVGRNFDELVRVLSALQRSDTYKIATPADWKQGEQVIVRFDVSDEEAVKLFGEDKINKVKPYLRFTSDPKQN